MSLFKRELLFNVLNNDGAAAGGGTPPPTEPPSPPPAGAATPPPIAAAGIDWSAVRGSLAKELQEDPSMKSVTSVEGLVKSYIHAQKAIGNKIPVPDKHATPEDWKQIFSKLGNPEKIEDYKYNMPKDSEVNQDFVNELNKAAHEAGVLPFQMEKIFGKYYEIAKGTSAKGEEDLKNRLQADQEYLKKEWGEAYEVQTRKANVAFKELLPDESLRQRLIEDGLGSHPAVVKMLANAAKFFKEDVMLGQGEGSLSGLTPGEALLKAQEIQGNPQHPYRNPAHPSHKAAKQEVQNLYKTAFPS
jgi:hypothetical protein